MTMRIVVLATTLPARAGDGTPEFVLTLSEHLRRHAESVTIVAPMVRGSARQEEINGVQIRRFRYFPRRWEDLADGAIVPNLRQRPSRWLQVPFLLGAMVWQSRRTVRGVNATVVHAHWIIPGATVARLSGRPYVVTVHGADAYTLNGRLARALKKFSLHHSSATVPVSTAIAERIADLGPHLSPALPMGVDVSRVRTVIGGHQPTSNSVLFVGRLAQKKGLDDLIEALLSLDDVALRVIGDGPHRPALEAAAASGGIADRVTFLGHSSREEVLSEMSAAAVLAIPSKRADDGDEDGVPVVLAEGIAAGIPLVVTSAGGLGDYVTDGRTGWVVEPARPDQLRLAIQDALSDSEEARRRAAAATDEVLPRLDVTVIAQEYARLLIEAGD